MTDPSPAATEALPTIPFADFIKLEGFDNGFDHFHLFSPVLRSFCRR